MTSVCMLLHVACVTVRGLLPNSARSLCCLVVHGHDDGPALFTGAAYNSPLMQACRVLAMWKGMAHQHVLLCKHNIVSYGSERRYTPLPEVATETPAKGRASSPDAEMAFKSGLSDPGAKTSITITGRSPSKHSRAVGNSPLNSTGQPTRAAGNSPSGPGESNEGATALAKMMQRRPFKHKTQVEFYALPAGVKVQPEGLGLDHL